MTEQRAQRRLAAILAADVVGYSRLVEIDEAGTLARLKQLRTDLIDPKIAEDGGRVVKTMGDGVLVEFGSAVDAVRNALAIQSAMQENAAEQPDAAPLLFRVAVNVGDVVIDGDDIYGEGVNIAARLEGLCEPGAVFVSGAVYEYVEGKLDATFDDLGEQTVKNIVRPLRVYRVRPGREADDAETPSSRPRAAPPSEKPSIAVLPFQNMSGDPDQEYFADGIAEDIITELSRFHWFFVIARNSSFSYKGTSPDIRDVASELGVRYVLEGSVRKGGNRVRITAQLIDGLSGSHLWAERYDRDLEDIFAVQDEITRSIIGCISPGILSAEVQRAQRKDPGDLDAWECVVRAHWHVRRFTKEDNIEARRLLEKALEDDPANASALADLALAHHFSAAFGWSDSLEDSMHAQGEAARKAVAADDQDAVAHTALAIFELFSGRHDEAIRRLEKAISLNPNLAFARGYLGCVHAFGGDYDAALPCIETALQLSPLDPLVGLWHLIRAWAAFTNGRYDEAGEYAQAAIESNPEFADNYTVLAAASAHLGRQEDARAALDELLMRLPGLRADDTRLVRPFRHPEDDVRLREGLRKAGLQE